MYEGNARKRWPEMNVLFSLKNAFISIFSVQNNDLPHQFIQNVFQSKMSFNLRIE